MMPDIDDVDPHLSSGEEMGGKPILVMSYFLTCRQCGERLYERRLELYVFGQCGERLYERRLELYVFVGHVVVLCPNCDYANQVRIMADGHVVRSDSYYRVKD